MIHPVPSYNFSGLNILVVNDSDYMRTLLGAILRSLWINKINIANEWTEGQRLVHSEHPESSSTIGRVGHERLQIQQGHPLGWQTGQPKRVDHPAVEFLLGESLNN